MTRKQCYILLGIREGSNLDEVKRAYRKRAFELHPDLNPAPDAGRKFQQLNEAYVLLLSFLEEENNLSAHVRRFAGFARKQPEAGADPAQSGENPGRPGPTGNFNSASDPAQNRGKNTESSGPGRQNSGAGATQSASARTARQTAGQSSPPPPGQGLFFNKSDDESHLSREEVLSGVLRDPFARRVFEDIYSEIRQSGRKAGEIIQKSGRDIAELFPARSARGVVNSVKGWLRRQIDDEQTVAVPVHSLRPGMRIRLQIQQGMSGEVQNIEVTIPLDYTPGRPVRLKGLGKKIGPWLGDLYLRIVPKDA